MSISTHLHPARLLSASRHSALPFLYPCCNAFAAVPTRRAMMSAFRSQPGPGPAGALGTPPNAPSTSASASALSKGVLVPDAAAPQIAARPPPLPKVEKVRPKIRASKAALTITPKAVGRLQGLLKGPTPQLIRIGVRNKGCAGLSYNLEYVDKPGKFDEVVEQDGVRVLIDSKALFSIIGSEMDWTEDALSDQPPPPTDQLDAKAFAAAVNNVHYPHLTPPMPHTPMASMSITPPSPSPSSPFAAVLPADLAAYLDDPRTLLVDIRPHAAYADARLPRALSLSVPSTLLKRPLFSLERLAAMLPSPAARHRFTAFHDSARILVYDADANAIPDSSNIHGLLRKFRAANYVGELAWLRGGFQGVWREQRHLIDKGPTPEEHDDDDIDDTGPASPLAATPILRTRHLPMSAFGLSSTTLPLASPLRPAAFNPFFDAVRQNTELSHGITERIPLRLPNRVRRRISDLPFPWLREIARRADRMPGTQHHPRVHMHMHMPGPQAYTRTRPYPTPSASPSASGSSFSDSSDSDAAPNVADVDEGTEALAMQFYRIELAEQRRLMGVMEHHSKESGRHVHVPPVTELLSGANFPFSITAGVEKGAKNRYRHIWPFEHARVRLCEAGKKNKDGRERKKSAEVDDYVNASYVQPLGTTRRYIATQGPLEATFEDFWRLTWQQNVHVIVMLTQEVEGAMVKCGTYWPDPSTPERTFGALRLTLVAKLGLPAGVDLMHEEPPAPLSPTGFGFSNAGQRRRKSRVTTIKRVFRLEHRDYPGVGVREVVQLQYLEWPDMNVPEDARGVLGLVREVDRAVEETGGSGGGVGDEGKGGIGAEGDVDPVTGLAWYGKGGRRPVLLHCSAGVGRTGGFIAMDAVLDAVRREFRNKRESERNKRESEVREGKKAADGMDVDVPGDVPPPSAALTLAGQEDGNVVTVPLPVSGDPSSGNSGNSSSGLVVHVPAVVVPSPTPEDTPMTVDTEEQTTRQWAESVDSRFTSPPISDSGFSFASPPPSSSPVPVPTFPTMHDGGAGDTRKNHPAALKMNLPPPSTSMSSASASASSGSVFPFFSDVSDGGVNRMRGGSAADSSLGTSVSGGEASESEVGDIMGRAGEEEHNQPFRTISEPQSQAFTGRTNFQLSLGLGLGLGLGSSPPSKSSTEHGEVKAPQLLVASPGAGAPFVQSLDPPSAQHHLPSMHPLSRSPPPLCMSRIDAPPPAPVPISRQVTTVDYKKPRALHAGPTIPVALSTYEEPIWEVVQDMREQRMSLCQSLRQYVFVHQAVIEGALLIVDEELEKEMRLGEAGMEGRRGEEVGPTRYAASPLPLGGTSFSFGSGGAAMSRSNTLPSPFPPDSHHNSPSATRPSLPLPPMLTFPQMPQMQKYNSTSSIGGFSSDSGSMKRGASPTELLKEGKKGEVLLSKRPSIKRQSKGKDIDGSVPVLFETVPPSPRRLQ
ncbi:hypothetical protein DXG01_005750 [Tephrocybe rancida]|nr:hypothetical protein DXG01_005750 [Tephrocybe rancida]